MKLLATDFTWAAVELSCLDAAIRAVATVESRGKGFDDRGVPIILFEAHKFSEFTQHRFDESHPRISSLHWDRALYTGSNMEEHLRLEEAALLDREAALRAASWGLFQILGDNWQACGYASLQEFINAAYHSERGHLEMFVGFLKNNPRMRKALVNHDWVAFARMYNGPAFAKNHYDAKLAAAYKKFSQMS
jgi:hypothetical protein